MTDDRWQTILTKVSAQVSRPNFVTWLENSQLLVDETNIAIVSVANPYAVSWVEKNIKNILEQLITEEYPLCNEVRVAVDPSLKKERAKKTKTETPPPLLEEIEDKKIKHADTSDAVFNPKYTFENFVVGNNTRLASAAAQVVADKPGESYNPLFLYGGVGLGKTHLMQAIGNEIRRRFPEKKIIYTSCETFTSEFIQSLQNKTVNQFKSKYRGGDILLIDDVQFLANKEGTQEEFFHTFNLLHQSNRQIVMTSDRMPKEIQNLEDRLTSRFGWGLIADIQSPNFETRLAILQSKSQERKLAIPQDVLEYIADTITTNVRELEGSLIKLETAARVEGAIITKEFCKKSLKDLSQDTTNERLSTQQVLRSVADYFNLEVSDILRARRNKEFVYPRQVVMYILREHLRQSFPQIGEQLGGKDHTTVMHGVDKISSLRKTTPSVESDISNILKTLNK